MGIKLFALLAAGLFVIGSVYVLRTHSPSSLADLIIGSHQQKHETVAHAQGPPAKPQRRETRHKPLNAVHAGPEEQPAAMLRSAASAATAPVRLSKPDASEILPEMSMSDVVDKFGEPDYMASWSDGGKLNRKLIYADGPAGLEVNIQDGRVISTDE